jgi:cell division initiation protein
MRLTPLDIRKQEFKKAMRGLESDEVYAFLSTIADEYEAVINDNKALRERLLELDDKVQEYRNMEKTLRDTLLTAERVTVEAKENARREADLITKEAQIEAEKAVRDIRNTAMRLRQDIQTLKQQKESYLSRLKVLVESHMRFVETAETDFLEEERRLEAEQQGLETTNHATGRGDPQNSEFKEILDQVIENQKDALKVEVPEAERDKMQRADVEAPPPPPSSTPTAVPSTVETAANSGPREIAAADLPAMSKAEDERGGEETDPTEADWSLDKLKRDILTGSTTEDESGR